MAITGAAGPVGERLARALGARDDVGRIVAVDLREPGSRLPGVELHRLDLASDDLAPLLGDADVVVHLASIVDPVSDETAMARVDVEGTHRVLEAATGAGAVIRVSPSTVYGAWANNPVPLAEDAPLRPNPGFSPAIHAAEVERMLHEWGRDRPGVRLATLRAAPLVGPGAQRLATRLLLGRPPLRVRGAAPPVQVLHLDDLVSALELAVTTDLVGAHNVAPDGWVAAEDAAELVGRTVVPALPAEVLERALARTWSSGVGDIPPGVVPLLVHPCVVANDRLRAAGWRPTHTNEEALVEGLEALEPGDRSRLVRGLAIGAAAAAATGATAGWLLRRRSRGS